MAARLKPRAATSRSQSILIIKAAEMEMEKPETTLIEWQLEHSTRKVMRCFMQNSCVEMIHYGDICHAFSNLLNADRPGSYANTLALLSEVCLRTYKRDFDLEKRHMLALVNPFIAFDDVLRHVCMKFEVDDETLDALIRKWDKIWNTGCPLDEQYIEDCDSFTRDAKALMRIIDSKMGKTHLVQMYELFSNTRPTQDRSNNTQMPGIHNISKHEEQKRPVKRGSTQEKKPSPPLKSARIQQERPEQSTPVRTLRPRGKEQTTESAEVAGNNSLDMILDEDVVTPSPSKSQGKRRTFSEDEIRWLRSGVRKYGVGNWTMILRNYPFHAKRTAVNLKDKWRNINKQAR